MADGIKYLPIMIHPRPNRFQHRLKASGEPLSIVLLRAYLQLTGSGCTFVETAGESHNGILHTHP
jgi:hypothetical protein